MTPDEILTNLTQFETLYLTIIGEARGEPIEGQVAVGCVIRNRVTDTNTYKQACLAPKQFSCWNRNDPNFPLLMELGEGALNSNPIKDPYLKQCIYVAQGIYEGRIMDSVHGAKNYMTTKLFLGPEKPKWAVAAKIVNEKGSHVFLHV